MLVKETELLNNRPAHFEQGGPVIFYIVRYFAWTPICILISMVVVTTDGKGCREQSLVGVLLILAGEAKCFGFVLYGEGRLKGVPAWLKLAKQGLLSCELLSMPAASIQYSTPTIDITQIRQGMHGQHSGMPMPSLWLSLSLNCCESKS